MNKTGIINQNKALILLQEMGVEIDSPQFHNWIGSGKVLFTIERGHRVFDEAHMKEVGQRWLDSGGRAYSVYRYDRDSGRVIEYINSYQCGKLWFVDDRQVQNIIASGKVPHLKIGNEYFVRRENALRYQASR